MVSFELGEELRKIFFQSDSWLPMQWETILLNLAKTLLISHYKWNIWSLCCENHSIASLSSSGPLGVKEPIFACFADILSLPERIVAWSLLQHRTMDSVSPQSWAISKLFSTASASTITFILKAIVYKEWRAFGMMREITVTKYLTETFVRLQWLRVLLCLCCHVEVFTSSLIRFFSFVFILIH